MYMEDRRATCSLNTVRYETLVIYYPSAYGRHLSGSIIHINPYELHIDDPG